MKKSWYKMQAKAGTPKAAEITIFDEIGFWGVTAASFISELKALGDVETIDVLINSPGGSVFDGLAIYNALRQHKASVNVTVMGVAASAASFIAMAGDKITMPENAFLMVHNAMGGVFGNAQEMRDWADTLDKIGASLIGIYVARTGKSEAEVKALLDAELDGSKGVAMSFRPWDGQLRQTMLLTDGQGVIGAAPVDGVLHPKNSLDTLGVDAPEKLCKVAR